MLFSEYELINLFYKKEYKIIYKKNKLIFIKI